MDNMTDSVREAVRIELAKRDWNRTKLAEETGLSRQYISELMSGKAGVLSPAWQRVFDKLGLELVLQPRGRN
jgi:transcriptional regulator with XRE-family HTH domain